MQKKTYTSIEDFINNFSEVFDNALDSSSYYGLFDQILKQPEKHPAYQNYLEYIKLNVSRIKRNQKIQPNLTQTLPTVSQKWLIITEPWCGDAAQSLPIAQNLANELGIECRYLLRDHYLSIMDLFLTQGSRSIPKIIGYDTESKKIAFTWGPRPAPLQEFVIHAKENQTANDWHKQVQKWYNQDQGKTTVSELLNCLSS